MNPHKPIFLTTLLASALMLSACSGGSGGDKKPPADDGNVKPPITGGNSGGGTNAPGGGAEDSGFFGPSGEFRNLDKEPNDIDDETLTELDGLTNLKGQVNSVGDPNDGYGFGVDESGSYRLTLTGFEGNDLNLFVFDMQANPVFTGVNAPGQNEVAEIELEAGVDYVLVIQGADTAGQTSDYRLVVEKNGDGSGGNTGGGSNGGSGSSESEPNDQASQSNEILPNTEINGTLNATEDAVDYYQIDLQAGDNLIVLYGLNGSAVNFDITAGPGGPVIASGQPMSDPEGFRRTLAIDKASRWGIRVVATDTDGRDQPYTLAVIPQ